MDHVLQHHQELLIGGQAFLCVLSRLASEQQPGTAASTKADESLNTNTKTAHSVSGLSTSQDRLENIHSCIWTLHTSSAGLALLFWRMTCMGQTENAQHCTLGIQWLKSDD